MRTSVTYSSRVGWSNPAPMTVDSHGAARKITTIATVMTSTAAVSTVRPNSLARPSSSSWRRLLKIGTNGAVRPAATSTSSAISGMRKAALYASSSGPAP